ncbi:hypothetical protein BWQ96_00677 [Gracilariopsis chorda]|uniref:Uncharacterized protein n=1 Tax=Gracilariopsis chorda TaxID=448386 RepID=A0A2V3J6I6_9FLOR|nr:hypothetical protein BWQ96_00677 [Gracilariopsis chorda]|eukprot:PXF49607.1 hypothetical protein BWQ96_00677 [Gracilariopsis chorda]
MQESLQALKRVLIDRYVLWHHSTVSKVREGELDGSSVRTLVFVGNEGRHGLGDRLRGMLFAYLAAVFSNRLLLIHWQDPFPLSTVLVNSVHSNYTYDASLFPSRTKEEGGEEDKVYVKKATLMEMHLFTGIHRMLVLECEPRPSLDDVFKAMRKFPRLQTSIAMKKILPLRRRPHPNQFFPLIFKALLRPSAALRKMMAEIIDKHNRFAPSRLWKQGPLKRIDTGKPFISVHARLGYGVAEYIKRFKSQMSGRTMESVAECMAQIAMRLAKRENVTHPPRFYLATDTEQFRLMFKTALMRMDRQAKVMYGTWVMKHVKEMQGHTTDDLRLFRYTFMDLYIMSKGEAILRSNSGFPNLAVWMGGIPSQMGFNINDCPLVLQGA